jgi:hypothetical protein
MVESCPYCGCALVTSDEVKQGICDGCAADENEEIDSSDPHCWECGQPYEREAYGGHFCDDCMGE